MYSGKLNFKIYFMKEELLWPSSSNRTWAGVQPSNLPMTKTSLTKSRSRTASRILGARSSSVKMNLVWFSMARLLISAEITKIWYDFHVSLTCCEISIFNFRFFLLKIIKINGPGRRFRVRQAALPPAFQQLKVIQGTSMWLDAMIRTESLDRNPLLYRAEATRCIPSYISLYLTDRPLDASV